MDAKISIMLPSASYVVPPTTSDIAEAVRDVDNTAPASNSLGEAVNEGGDPLSNPVPGSYAPGTAGKVLGDNLNATVSSRSTYAGTDTPGTTTLLTRVPVRYHGDWWQSGCERQDRLLADLCLRPAKTAASAW